MKSFELRKVVDPHQHMPEEVQEAHHEMMCKWDHGNDSFHFWTVGEFDYAKEDDTYLSTLAKWFNDNFEKGEELIVLSWW
jgi:hypothetical protein